ncbi:uncharacterized protein LOC110600802 isoform X2 [Manihot esculenta]|uniref:THUMP domain-containing protein n=3 Tax=Manihot esculenta TaxID=3983 RepID=A0A2C9UFU8_MANES|nr:uncharacterized protein LOC110600802 isoform X2 [Manihot esculenta]KAG8637605.1 hypothetical protein MANES_15G141000v8 [Manihot esculenta]KAG8637606.1 hypothetical protein MANES_15G141000v8 [Manihot esculenta]OAY29387.1 hypothetical protein MANES_15G141000v8 [Manihot esculenta]
MAGEKEESQKVEEELKPENENEDEEPTVEEELKEKQSDSKRMKPWEQHAAVINLPRFDYNAPSALLQRSYSGFLVTCSIKREKSATKEVMSILDKYIGSYNYANTECLESSDASQSTKRRKTQIDEIGGISAEGMERKSTSEDTGNMDSIEEKGSVLSLVKLTRSGLLLLTFARENSPDPVAIVSNIFQCVESGSLRSPLWCHRIFPIQATCLLDEKELRTVVSKLVLQFVNDKQNKLAHPTKFAVGYNRRGIEETQTKHVKDSNMCSLLDRNKCFEIVASVVKEAVPDSSVDLKSPELSILVELLPLSRVPNGSLLAAVSVLPQNLVSVKPRLCIKPLVPDGKAKNEGVRR